MVGESLALLAMVLFATNILVTKFASSRLAVASGFVISVTVNLLFACVAFVAQLAWQGHDIAWDLQGVLLFALAGLCATWLGRWFFFEAIARLGPARASLFHVSSPAFTLLLAWMFLAESLGVAVLAAVVATIAGLFLVSTPPGVFRRASVGAGQGVPRGTSRVRAWLASGFAIGFSATIAYSVGNVLRGAAIRQWNEPVAGVMVGAAAALAMHLIVGKGHGEFLRGLRTADRAGVRLYVLAGVLTICAQMATVASMRHIPVAVASVITLATPLVVLPVSYWVLKNQERIGARTLIGAALTLGGVAAIVVV
jgi:drug/metabolite transporter (DMT)-like permease